ncbi:MAG: hypothetical protein Q4A04_00010 [Eubacteriales bacterium]|nr:hypothetical protein [Eubacteriales bacterium]
MKEYQEPTATIVEFSVKDIVVTSGGEDPTGSPTIIDDTGTEPGSIMRFD